MATTELRIRQDALRLLADARLALITDDVESAYALEDAWEGAVDFVLRQAAWRFALTRVQLATVGSPAPLPGYARNFGHPADILRTHKLFIVTSDGRECPVDLRESGNGISTNATTLWGEFVSSDYNDQFNTWPEHFSQTVAAYLAFSVAERVTGERGASGRMSQLFSQLLGEAVRIDAVPDDPWLPFQRTGEMLQGARDLLRRGFWRFALTDAVIDTESGTPARGFAHAFALPTDHMRTHRVFTLPESGRETLIDFREQGGRWSANVDEFNARYVSSTLGLDSTRWDEPFRSALLGYLQAGRPQMTEGEQEQAPPWFQAVLLALEASADPSDPWLRHQLSGDYERAKDVVLREGFWTWRGPDGVMRGLREVQYTAEPDQLPAQPAYGFPYRYDLPDDWFRTHSLHVPWDGQDCPINIRESAHDWSTDAETFVARYVALDVLDAAFWPEEILNAVYAWCDWQTAGGEGRGAAAQEYATLLSLALRKHSQPANEWLRFQLDGSYQIAVKKLLETGRWRFAVKTRVLTETTDPLPAEEAIGDPVAGYAYRFIQPNDLLRTIRVYHEWGVGQWGDRVDIDFIDEAGAYHANFTPVTVRYVSRLGLDSTKWPANFRDALLAWLQYEEARRDLASTNIAAAKLALYKDAERRAERLDDARDHPRIIPPRTLERARRGGGYYRRIPYSGTPTPTSPDGGTVLTDEDGVVLTPG